jgi:CBS domain-containing protein
MRVREIMSTPVIGVTDEATIEEAAELMMDRGYTTVPVFSEPGRLAGLLTEADLGLARYTAPEPTPEDGVITRMRPRFVRQIMRTPALAVDAGADLADLAAAMVESRQRSLPVVDRGLVVGMVSWRDLLARVAQDGVPAPS